MALVGSVEAGHSSGSENLNSTEDTDLVKNILGKTTTNGTTINSGSTNTSNSQTTGGTNGSTNTIGTAASVNTSVTGPSTSNTYNSGRVDTSQLMLTDEAVNHLTKQMMESTQGLASVSKGEHASGAYNSTTNTLLTNDLLSRVAGEVAAKSAKTVNTIGASTSSTTNSGSTTTNNIGATKTTQDIGPTSTFSDSAVSTIIGGSTSQTQSIADVMNTETSKQTVAATKQKDTTQTETKAKGGWILCTELRAQNRMPYKHYVFGFRSFAKYDEQGKKGYYIWAVPALKHLRKYPLSNLSKLICITMNARAEYLAAEQGCPGANKSVLGFIVKHSLYGICWTLSRTIARNYEVPAFTSEGVTS